MKNHVIVYLANNDVICYIKKENKFMTCHLNPQILKNGKLIHRPRFIKEFAPFLKKQKIIKRFQRNIIYFITPPNFEEVDKEIIKTVFEELPIEEVKFQKETNLYQLKKNSLWININEKYAFITFLKKREKGTIVWVESQKFGLSELIERLIKTNPNIKKIILIGANKKIPILANDFEEKYKKIVLYYEDHDLYLIKEAIRHNFP